MRAQLGLGRSAWPRGAGLGFLVEFQMLPFRVQKVETVVDALGVAVRAAGRPRGMLGS